MHKLRVSAKLHHTGSCAAKQLHLLPVCSVLGHQPLQVCSNVQTCKAGFQSVCCLLQYANTKAPGGADPLYLFRAQRMLQRKDISVWQRTTQIDSAGERLENAFADLYPAKVRCTCACKNQSHTACRGTGAASLSFLACTAAGFVLRDWRRRHQCRALEEFSVCAAAKADATLSGSSHQKSQAQAPLPQSAFPQSSRQLQGLLFTACYR